MNKNIIKIIIKTIFAVIFMGIAMLLFIAMLIEKSDSYGIDSNLEYAYEYGNYNDLNNSFVWYDGSDKKYNDDWLVNEANNLRFEYKIYQKRYEQTADTIYEKKMQEVKDAMDSCAWQIEDTYKQDVVRMFIDSLEEK